MVSPPTRAITQDVAQPENAPQVTPRVTLQGIRWQTYQALLNDLGDHRAVRLTYTQGILEIAMPSKLHEILNRLMARIVTTLTEELALEIVNVGSTILDREDLQHGAEPIPVSTFKMQLVCRGSIQRFQTICPPIWSSKSISLVPLLSD